MFLKEICFSSCLSMIILSFWECLDLNISILTSIRDLRQLNSFYYFYKTNFQLFFILLIYHYIIIWFSYIHILLTCLSLNCILILFSCIYIHLIHHQIIFTNYISHALSINLIQRILFKSILLIFLNLYQLNMIHTLKT